MWHFTFQDIDFSEKYLIKNGENDISELLDFNLSWGSMPLDPPNVSRNFAPFVFYGSLTYVPCRCMENMKQQTLLSRVYFHKTTKGVLICQLTVWKRLFVTLW